ncbi:MAG: hypothetical protein AAGA53_01245 [Pseudomonadota bacterium]
MKAHTASLLNAITLMIMSAWAYLSSQSPSFTALIPAAFGLALVGCYFGVKNENKVIAHIAVILTLIVFLVLFVPLNGAIGRGDGEAILRLSLMIVTSLIALVFFIKSFRDARKARE